jgi:predicted AAA+ superfamily ATPase
MISCHLAVSHFYEIFTDTVVIHKFMKLLNCNTFPSIFKAFFDLQFVSFLYISNLLIIIIIIIFFLGMEVYLHSLTFCRVTLLLGPPGCGKTSLLKALSGNLDQSLKVLRFNNT